MTASSTAEPSVTGLFSASGSASSTGDISSILAGTGLSGIGSIIGGVGNIIGNGISSVVNWFGWVLNYRIVHLHTDAGAIMAANGDAIKIGKQVTIPYTATASGVMKDSEINKANNRLDTIYTDGSDQGDAFKDSSFANSTTTLNNLLNSSSTSTTASQAASTGSTSATNWFSTFGLG